MALGLTAAGQRAALFLGDQQKRARKPKQTAASSPTRPPERSFCSQVRPMRSSSRISRMTRRRRCRAFVDAESRVAPADAPDSWRSHGTLHRGCAGTPAPRSSRHSRRSPHQAPVAASRKPSRVKRFSASQRCDPVGLRSLRAVARIAARSSHTLVALCDAKPSFLAVAALLHPTHE